ncbi:hypothetical protein [Kordia jejudonensis]|uniref:hypothetical protein n=1 Tax=Kordia jejudonensis TaxID=1348245 RepID=UPI000629810F|nr:hypothetical protein [Kordia jejudonensis]
MKSKIFKIFAFVFIAQILLYACCDDEFNVSITSFEFTAKDNVDNDSAVVTNQDFYLQFRSIYQVDLISLISKNSGLINTANATSCYEEYNRVNLAESITLTANVPLFGIPAGSSLNDHVIVQFAFNTGNQITMNDLLLEVNASINDFDVFLRFDTAIPEMTTVNFTMTTVLDNQEILENTTTAITFE